MFQDIEFWLRELIAAQGALGVFLIGILEEVVFIIPSSLVFLGAGFLLIAPEASFANAVFAALINIGIPAALGVTLGSFFIYGIVYAGGKPTIARFGKYVGLTWEEIEAAEKKFTAGRMDETLLFILRALPIFPISIISAVCGLIRLPWKEFFVVTLLGAFVRASGSALVGWGVGKEYAYYASQFEVVEKYGLVALVIGGIVAYWQIKKRLLTN
ncbi:MAG: VTT domain-containing protein [bacterium]|nr:VTT domain-containing protein [bacterium]